MSATSVREKRRLAREAKRRKQRITIASVSAAGVLLIAVIIFLAANNKTTLTQVKVEDLVEGSGVPATTGNTLTVNYTGWLEDGTKFDSSLDRNQPLSFQLGAGNVIKGWDEGLVGMKVGGKRRLTIPPSLAYGATGSPPVIPANATLIFEVELLEIK